MNPQNRFFHPYLPQTEAQIETMLETIGISTIDDLFSVIPVNLRFKEKLDLPTSHSEQESLDIIKNNSEFSSNFGEIVKS